MENIFGLSATAIADLLEPLKLPGYRAGQIARWMYKRGARTFDEMTDLPQKLRFDLAAQYKIVPPHPVTALHSKDGATSKYLLAFEDGAAVETVLMRQSYGNSVCVSTQVGCNMGCAFCVSGMDGVERNLTAAEILGEVLFHQKELQKAGGKVDTVVIMGSGEPLMNYEAVLSFIRLLHDKDVLALSYRSITLSTCGIVTNIYRLTEENIPISLAISLHAANNDLRSRLMPVNRQYPVEEVVAAACAYAEKTGRQVTFEYILIDGVNDGKEDAASLVKLLKDKSLGRAAISVNLIPINPGRDLNFRRPTKERVAFFQNYLLARRITATVRKEMGADIAAACGQLRRHIV